MKIIECPRDAIQGLQTVIPTDKKVRYINSLLKVGFDTIDFGSFVSPKAIPQMADTPEVLQKLDIDDSTSKLLAIVANKRGAKEAVRHEAITYLGFPLSLSETFQQRNTNRSIDEAFRTVAQIQEMCTKSGREMVVYLSMGFGNPYGDPYSAQHVTDFSHRLIKMGIRIISLADTVGTSTPEWIKLLYGKLVTLSPEVEIGLHLHSRPDQAEEKILAAMEVGCQRMDGALLGYGGCPMAKDDLVGNLDTQKIVELVGAKQLQLDPEAFAHSVKEAHRVFG